MTITISISGKAVEDVQVGKHKHLTEAQIVAYLKNKYVNRIVNEPWEIVMTVMSKMHRIHVSDYTLRKHIKDEPDRTPIDRTGFDRYSNKQAS